MQLSNIEDVARAVRDCRAQGVRAYPEALWQRIGELCRRYSIPDGSRRTGLSVHYLQQRLSRRPSPSRFCEVNIEAPVGARAGHSVLAVRRPDGSEMAIESSGAFDIGRIVAEFMRP
jgi:hypothetical protein